jgi:integrase
MFMVDARKSHFPRSRRTFYQAEEEALAVAEALERELANHGVQAFADLSGAHRKDAVEAFEILAPFEGATLLKAAQHFAEYKAAEKKRMTGPTVAAALSAYLDAKIADYKAGRIKKVSLYDIQSKSRYIEVGFGKLRVSEIDEAKAKAFLNGLRLRPRGRENVRLKLSQFLNFCITRKWITENSVGKLSEKIPTTDVEILSPQEAERLLRIAWNSSHAASVLPYLAVSLFAGLRPGEAQQSRWEWIHFETKQLEIPGHTSKTKETRFVTLESILAEWLLPFRKSKAPIVGKNFTRDLKAIKTEAGFGRNAKPWSKDVLRHSFASYWLAIYKDRARLAEEMGNSLDVIKRF